MRIENAFETEDVDILPPLITLNIWVLFWCLPVLAWAEPLRHAELRVVVEGMIQRLNKPGRVLGV